MRKEIKKTVTSNTIWFIILCLVIITAYLGLSGYIKIKRMQSRDQVGKLLACTENCEKIGIAIELYKDDHQGKFPDKIMKLYPKYMKEIPNCPAAGYDTYSDSYKTERDNELYSFYCKGTYHNTVGTPTDYPRYDSSSGLHIKPEEFN